MNRDKEEVIRENPYRRDFITTDHQALNGETFMQAINGFLMILDCNGELFFATHSIESCLGFHQVTDWGEGRGRQTETGYTVCSTNSLNFQSDVIHHSVYELVHSEDREELQKQLLWSTFLQQDDASLTLQVLSKC